MEYATLEQEFLYYAAKSKVSIVKRLLVDYYRTLEQTQVNLSGAFYETPEQKADYAIRQLVLNDLPKFEHLYNTAYAELFQ